MKKWIKTHIILSVIIISLVIMVSYFIIGFWNMDSETQDVSITSNISDGVIIFDDSRIAVGGVCLPKIRQGKHNIKIEKDTKIVISQEVDIGDVSWRVLDEEKSDNDVKLEVKLDNCQNWNK